MDKIKLLIIFLLLLASYSDVKIMRVSNKYFYLLFILLLPDMLSNQFIIYGVLLTLILWYLCYRGYFGYADLKIIGILFLSFSLYSDIVFIIALLFFANLTGLIYRKIEYPLFPAITLSYLVTLLI
jgi:Flp pilus assembly protein protease CpaA